MDHSEETPRWRDGTFTEEGQAASPQAALATNLAGHVRVVAVLMIIQGALESLAGLLLVGLAVVFPLIMEKAKAEDPDFGEMQTGLAVTVYGVLGAGLVLIGAVRVLAGWRNYRFRSRMLGIVAVSMGLATVATCYCAPTSIGLAIYALIVYLNPAVEAAFEAGDSVGSSHRKVTGESPFGPAP